jgi:hypothetical protein
MYFATLADKALSESVTGVASDPTRHLIAKIVTILPRVQTMVVVRAESC